MFLYYDRLSQMFTLDMGDDGYVFLGPIYQAMVDLKHRGFTDSQAREAVLQAIFNMGDAVHLNNIKKIANNESRYFSRVE
jgi:hypothetical protein